MRIVLAIALALPLALAVARIDAFSQTPTSTDLVFDASNHLKSQGARLTVTYPGNFIARESARQRIVQSFFGSRDGVDVAMTLGIEASGEDVEAYCASQTPDYWRQIFTAPNMDVLNVRRVSWKTRPAVMISAEQITEFGGTQFHTRVITLSICHKRHRISLSCGTSGSSTAEVLTAMQRATPTCERFYDSLKFNN